MATSTGGKRSRSGQSSGGLNQALNMDFVKQIEQIAPWETWADKLVNRKKPAPLHKILPDGVRDALLWSVTSDTSADTVDLLKLLSRLKKDRNQREPADWCRVVDDWLVRTRAVGYSTDYALECLGWAHALTRMAPRLTADKWWELAASLIGCASDALKSMVLDTKYSDFSVLHVGQLLTCELPLTLAYWFPRIDVFREMGEHGTKALSESIIELLDGEGMPHARHLANLQLLLACWTRSIYLDKNGPGGRIEKDARLQFEWLVRQSLRLRRADGKLTFGKSEMSSRILKDILISALEVAGDDTDRELFAAADSKKKDHPTIDHLPTAGEHSEWAELAVLRTNWTSDAAICAISFCGNNPSIELSIGKRVLAIGEDLAIVHVNGKLTEMTQSWEEICWESDDDVDYIELETRLDHGLLLQRQFALFRDEMLLYTADAIVGATKGEFQYERRMPFTNEISFQTEEETRELTISLDRTVGKVFPLALPEWRAGHHHGSLSSDGTLRQASRGDAIYAPLLIDLDPKRARKQLTWRQLTVAEKLQIVAPDVAVAFRIQIGKEQWVIYRSLAAKSNRTFLGQNHSTEFLFARFASDGEVDTLVEVE